MLEEWVSGGAGTIMCERIDEETAKDLMEIKNQQYFSDAVDELRKSNAFNDLSAFLSTRGVGITSGAKNTFDSVSFEAFELTLSILKLIPDHHFGGYQFQQLCIGGWSGSAAKTSEYVEENGRVHMYDFATKGPRRNYAALLLHEIGHSFEHLLSYKDFRRLKESYLSRIPLLGIDYLLGESERISNQGSFPEFIAETYLSYITQGGRLHSFINSLQPSDKGKWREIYSIFKKNFGGLEYID
jgi:hypothetical protein